jgi:hypothetical protein
MGYGNRNVYADIAAATDKEYLTKLNKYVDMDINNPKNSEYLEFFKDLKVRIANRLKELEPEDYTLTSHVGDKI